MYLFGSFVNKRGQTVKVEILTTGSNAVSKEISRGSDVVFPDDPVEIRCESDASESHLVRSSASIRLLTRGFMPDLYCSSVLDGVVNIHVGGICVFAGYIVPQSYSQPFSSVYDEYEINCIDALSALQNLKYKGIGTVGVDYDNVRASALTRTFTDILEEILCGVAANLDLSGVTPPSVVFDSSKGLPGSTNTIFSDLSISELLFLGDDETDVWTQQEVVEEIMRYLDLRIVQEGNAFRIYSVESLNPSRSAISWSTLKGVWSGNSVVRDIGIATSIAMDTDASITIGEVYNRVELTCEVKEMDSLVESPLDSDTMRSPYTNRQLYMREYSMDAGGTNAARFVVPLFKALVDDDIFPDNIKCSITDWYVRVYDSMRWRFLSNGSDLVLGYCSNNEWQDSLPHYLASHPGAALIAFGSAKREKVNEDNSLKGSLDMETSLFVSVNGNGKDSDSDAFPTVQSLLAASPVAEYKGRVSGGVFSPSDSETVNYIVMTGRIVLNPLLQQVLKDSEAPWHTGTWPVIENNPDHPIFSDAFSVPGKDYTNGRLYCTQWFKAKYPHNTPVVRSGPGLMPFTNEVPGQYEFKYSAVGDATDTISKVGVLACMLVIGNKCVVETGTDGQVTDFEWKTYKTREECSSDDEYYQQSFTIGFNPKIGDLLIGTEYDIQNNIDYRMGLDMEGTAIPIRKEDNIRGDVSFRILGPVNVTWDEVTRRHKTWFRRAKWSSSAIPLMSHVSSVIIKDFEVKVVSDNGLVSDTDDGDLVYMSDTDETFTNLKDDLKFRITTGLTREERLKLGISDSLKLSSPLVTATGEALLKIKNSITGDTGKPEQLYVDSVYRESHLPRLTLIHKLRSTAGVTSMFNRFTHPALSGKVFRVSGISRGLSSGWDEVTLKEIAND